MDELCRELGDRGTHRAAEAVEASSVVLSSHQPSSVAAALLGDDATSRIDFVDGLLECTNRTIATSVNRKDRKQLSRRTEALLDNLDQDVLPTWLASIWTEEQSAAMIGASEALIAAENATSISSGDVASAVANVLAAIDQLVASHVDKAKALLASMQSRELGEVVAVLAHGLTMLEKLSASSTRKARKAIDDLCERLEHAIESLDEDDNAMEQLASCEVSELTALAEQLKATSKLDEEAGNGCVPTVTVVLETLARCCDPVLGASRQLTSVDGGTRMRGLEMLRALPRVILPEAAAVELSMASIAVGIGLDSSRDCGERQAAIMSVFVLGFRNGNATTELLGKLYAEGVTTVMGQVFSNKVSGREGVALMAAWYGISFPLLAEMALKSQTAVLRGAAQKAVLTALRGYGQLECTAGRYAELLPMQLELCEHEDIVLASGAALSINGPVIASGAACAPVIVASREYPEMMLALLRRIDGRQQLRRPVAWWKERSEAVHLDSVCWNGVGAGLTFCLSVMSTVQPNSAAWEELLAEAIHLCKVNKEAELSAQPRMTWYPFHCAAKIVQVAAREPARHTMLLASNVVDALMWTTAHDYPFVGSGLAEYSAGTTVALIGRNEGGLTLSQHTVDVVLNSFHDFWNTTSTHWRVMRSAKAPVKSIVGKAQPIVDMVIADANKPFVLEHATAIDDLVHGLLIDHSSPRCTQDGAGKLQETCALVLQNLALSDVGKGPLRSHASVMASLRVVASAEGGMTEAARQYASGALFELDEVARQKAKDAATAAKAADGDGGEAAEHVMLSYNWGHQNVIKRINSALKARGYSVWIDIEKMQGSTVEAMADAVEDAAVVCYGISQAYKESTNCRMEAQYAFQQQTDMVPLMLEESYRPKGWLGMILGVRLWYGFFGTTLASEGAFEGKMDELCRELGDRGK
eukprot:COSAG01_NODE_6039_length_3884_cov_2.766975_1_plen_928_part_00